MKTNIIILVILAILILISIVQAVQLFSLNNKISSGVVLKTSKISTSSSPSNVKTPSSLDNLPQMVGGC